VGAIAVSAEGELETRGVNQLQQWASTAAAWVSDNSTDVVYIAAAIAAFLLLTSGGGRR
jgi:hypothetical protein